MTSVAFGSWPQDVGATEQLNFGLSASLAIFKHSRLCAAILRAFLCIAAS